MSAPLLSPVSLRQHELRADSPYSPGKLANLLTPTPNQTAEAMAKLTAINDKLSEEDKKITQNQFYSLKTELRKIESYRNLVDQKNRSLTEAQDTIKKLAERFEKNESTFAGKSFDNNTSSCNCVFISLLVASVFATTAIVWQYYFLNDN